MDSKEKQVIFKMVKITTEQFAIIENCFQKESDINLETKLKFAANTESRIIGVFAQFQFTCQNTPFIIIEVGCHFEIKEESWLWMIKKDLTVPKEIMQHLCVLTVGTARGVLHAKTENSEFNRFILPAINISEMVNSDIGFGIDK